MINSRILSVGVIFPSTSYSIEDIEGKISLQSTRKLPVKTIQRLTGVQRVFHRSEGQNASDLAAAAARQALDRASLTINDIDLLIFASASQDLIEPATAHIVGDLLGSSCPVFDIKNACNSFLNGIQVADALIKSQTYKTVLIVTGETPSMAVRWACETKEQFLKSFAGFSMSDSGGAMLLQAEHSNEPNGVLSIEMSAHSEMWNIGTLPTGGSRHPRDIEATYFNMDGHKLYQAFQTVGCDFLFKKILEKEIDWNDFTAIGMHQVSTIYNEMMLKEFQLPFKKVITTIQDYGNVASNSLPLQLNLLQENKQISKSDQFAFIGLGGGISTGLGLFKL